MVASLAQTGLAKDAAEGCADDVLKGRSVVVVHAAFGGGAKATAALDKHAPIGGPPTKFEAAAPKAGASKTALANGHTLFSGELKDDAAPLSSYFKWPTLLDSPTPLVRLAQNPDAERVHVQHPAQRRSRAPVQAHGLAAAVRRSDAAVQQDELAGAEGRSDALVEQAELAGPEGLNPS